MAVLDNIITGSFTSDGTAKLLDIPCDLDYMEVINYTQMATQQATGRGVKFEWFRGMASDTGIEIKKSDNTDVLNGVTLTSGGFTLVDSSSQLLGPAYTGSGITNVPQPVVTLTSTSTGLTAGDVVRVTNTTSARQIAGMDFTIGTVTVGGTTTFPLQYMGAPGSAATAVTVRKVLFQPEFYPRNRFITAITQAVQAVVTMSVTHDLTVGQRVVFNIPDDFGMTQLNGVRARIVAINTTNNTITIDVDTSAFTAFAFPTSASVPFTFPQVIPFGDAPLTLLNPLGNQSVLDGSTRNTAFRGMRLAAGAQSPAGSASDVIYWKALKSSQIQTS